MSSVVWIALYLTSAAFSAFHPAFADVGKDVGVGELSIYSDAVTAELAKQWKARPPATCAYLIQFTVTADGRIRDIKLNADKSALQQRTVVEEIIHTSSLPPPPVGASLPFRIRVLFSGQLDVPRVEAADIDYGLYMSALQSKVRQHWHPPSGSQSVKVVASFRLWRGDLSAHIVFCLIPSGR